MVKRAKIPRPQNRHYCKGHNCPDSTHFDKPPFAILVDPSYCVESKPEHEVNQTQIHNSGPKPGIADTGCSHTVYRQSDASNLKNQTVGPGIRVLLPNGSHISATGTGILETPPVSTKVHIFDDNDLHRSLTSISDYCNQGCTATFTKTSFSVVHDATGIIVMQSQKLPSERLWMTTPIAFTPTLSANNLVNLPSDTTDSLSANNVVRHEINADFVAYTHASFGSPPDSSFAAALSKGYFGNLPRLTAAMFNANKPNSMATAKGHLDQKQQKSKRKPKLAKPILQPAVVQDISPPSYDEAEVADEAEFSNTVFLQVTEKSAVHNYSDITGRFPHISYRGFQYMLLSVFRGYVHVEPLKNREAAEIVRGYRATFEFFQNLSHSTISDSRQREKRRPISFPQK
jgi:hypothetical protein